MDINSFAPRRYDSSLQSIFPKRIIQNDSLGSVCEIVLRWIPHNVSIEKSTLVEVMTRYVAMASLGHNDLKIRQHNFVSHVANILSEIILMISVED